MTIQPVTESDFPEWFSLTLELWPDYPLAEMQTLMTALAQSATEAAYLIRTEQGTAVGFMNLSLRADYVPGATRKPVAYIEGLYVQEAYQKRGIGMQLIRQAEQWAQEQGCAELASDVLIDNTGSAEFHRKAGFEEVERTVFFIKNVSESRH